MTEEGKKNSRRNEEVGKIIASHCVRAGLCVFVWECDIILVEFCPALSFYNVLILL